MKIWMSHDDWNNEDFSGDQPCENVITIQRLELEDCLYPTNNNDGVDRTELDLRIS
jgi:hypothetical protein